MEQSEKERNRNEKLGEYFLNLSNTILGTTVLGMIVSSAQNFEDANIWMIVAIIGIGLIATLTFANIGKKFLNKQIMYGMILGYALIALAAIGVSLWFKTPAGKRWMDGK